MLNLENQFKQECDNLLEKGWAFSKKGMLYKEINGNNAILHFSGCAIYTKLLEQNEDIRKLFRGILFKNRLFATYVELFKHCESLAEEVKELYFLSGIDSENLIEFKRKAFEKGIIGWNVLTEQELQEVDLIKHKRFRKSRERGIVRMKSSERQEKKEQMMLLHKELEKQLAEMNIVMDMKKTYMKFSKEGKGILFTRIKKNGIECETKKETESLEKVGIRGVANLYMIANNEQLVSLIELFK